MPKQPVKRKSRIGSKKSVQKEPLLSRTQKIVSTIIACLILGGMLWNYGAKADARYMKTVAAEEFKKADTRLAAENKYTSDRLDIKIMQDRRNELDSRIYNVESSPLAVRPEVKANVREWKQEKQELEKKIDIKQNQIITPHQ